MAKPRTINVPQPSFIIRSEGHAQRCDICHQADEFDELSQTCRRCSGLALPLIEPTHQTAPFSFRLSTESIANSVEDLQAVSVVWASFFCGLLCLLAGLWSGNLFIGLIFGGLGALFGSFGGFGSGLLVGLVAHLCRWRESTCLKAGRVAGFLGGCLMMVLLLTIFLELTQKSLF